MVRIGVGTDVAMRTVEKQKKTRKEKNMNEKMVINRLADTLKKRYDSIPLEAGVAQFNVLDEVRVDENAHTRVLVRLLQIPAVCRSFVGHLAKMRPDLAEGLLPFDEEDFHVDCFSDYVDARIFCKDKVIIIENKARDAVDQDEQIDKYVNLELGRHQAKDIYVIYLTKDGTKKVQDYSFKDSKAVLEFKDAKHPGRFIEMNYKDHIVDWLKNGIFFSVSDTMTQPYLRSGIQQYIHYVEGPGLLNLRQELDPYAPKIEGLKACIREAGVADAFTAFTKIYRDYLVDQDPAESKFIEVMQKVMQSEAESAGVEQLGLWNSVDCSFGSVNHGYWFDGGYAIQLTENVIGGVHTVRAIEFFPQRGVEYGENLKRAIEEIAKEHPYFQYWWNGRSVYKFPVVEKDEAVKLCEKLKAASKTQA